MAGPIVTTLLTLVVLAAVAGCRPGGIASPDTPRPARAAEHPASMGGTESQNERSDASNASIEAPGSSPSEMPAEPLQNAPPVQAARAVSQDAPLELGRAVLQRHCGPCHHPAELGAKPAALAVFSVDASDWTSHMSAAQLCSALGRIDRLSEADPEGAKAFSESIARLLEERGEPPCE